MNPPTRLAFWAASWLLWATAALWRLEAALETRMPAGESWGTLAASYAMLALYGAAWVVWASTDVGYWFGYRR